jgi:hypothetical protein
MIMHTKLSYAKSGIRIVGFAFLPANLVVSAVFLVIAEAVGILEELPGMYKGTKIS